MDWYKGQATGTGTINGPDQLKDSNSKSRQVAKDEDSHNDAANLCQENIIHQSEIITDLCCLN